MLSQLSPFNYSVHGNALVHCPWPPASCLLLVVHTAALSVALHSQCLYLKTATAHHHLVFYSVPSLALAHTLPLSLPFASILLALVARHLSFIPPAFPTATFILCACYFLPGAFKSPPVFPLPTSSAFGTPHDYHFPRTIIPGHPPQSSSLFISSCSHLPFFWVTLLQFASLYHRHPSLCVHTEDKSLSISLFSMSLLL